MNTTQIGDTFESHAYGIINDALSNGKLGIYANQCKVFKKKGYYSKDRDSNIIFDLAIEVWPPGAQNYTLLYLIECKNYTHRVPVNDIEEFNDKIRQVSGVNAKGVFIANNEYQEGAFNFAKSRGMMLIHVSLNQSYEIIFHRVERNQNRSGDSRKLESWDDALGDFFESVFDSHSKVIGVKQLSTEAIEIRAQEFLKAMDPDTFQNGWRLPVDKLVSYLQAEYNVLTDFESTLGNDSNGNPILGYFDRQKNLIRIDRAVVGTERFLFTLCHEVGHVVLHQQLRINQKVYNQFKDSAYNFGLGKHQLKNEKNWIEWQANQFSACLILPKAALWARVYGFQKANGIRNAGTIWYDYQPINRKDFYDLTMFLTNFFGVSYTSIRFRLNETGIIKYADQKRGSHWTNYFVGSDVDEVIQNDPRRRLRID